MSGARINQPRDRDDPRQLRAAPIGDPPAEHDPREVARFLREQPPNAIPRRTYAAAVPGVVALPVLGGRVIRRLQGQE